MAEIVTLSCSSCRAKIQINTQMSRFACANCGKEHVVKREGGAVYLVPVLKDDPYRGGKECHWCRANEHNRREVPDMHRCQICQYWTCIDCLSSNKDGWVCKVCRP